MGINIWNHLLDYSPTLVLLPGIFTEADEPDETEAMTHRFPRGASASA